MEYFLAKPCMRSLKTREFFRCAPENSVGFFPSSTRLKSSTPRFFHWTCPRTLFNEHNIHVSNLRWLIKLKLENCEGTSPSFLLFQFQHNQTPNNRNIRCSINRVRQHNRWKKCLMWTGPFLGPVVPVLRSSLQEGRGLFWSMVLGSLNKTV